VEVGVDDAVNAVGVAVDGVDEMSGTAKPTGATLSLFLFLKINK
jgi:hypothetical protein